MIADGVKWEDVIEYSKTSVGSTWTLETKRNSNPSVGSVNGYFWSVEHLNKGVSTEGAAPTLAEAKTAALEALQCLINGFGE